MPPRCLTVLAAIRRGEEAPLRERLRAIGDDINGHRIRAAMARAHIDFPRSRDIHFARMALLADPDRGSDRARLLYASVYDGDLDDHLAELSAISGDLDAIWGACEDYSGQAHFGSFIRAHSHDSAAYYIAFRDETVESIRAAIARRRARDTGSFTPAPVPTPPEERMIATARAALRAAPVVVDLVQALARHGFARVYRGTARLIASLNRYRVFRWTNWVIRNQLPPMTSPYSAASLDQTYAGVPSVAGDEHPALPDWVAPGFREDMVAQNQLTLVTVVTPGQAERVRAVMSAINWYARRLSPNGSLIGISTIHFVRWLLIDDGRRLMMVSDYDGSWENYIDEFAEMILSGLDAIWETAIGYPPDGARDLPAFKRFLRSHQVPSDLFFSAYPDATVLNVRQDIARPGAW